MIYNIFKTLNENFSIKLFTLFAFFVFIIFFSFTAVFIHLEGKSLNDSLVRDGSLLAGVLAQNTRIGVFSENEELLKARWNLSFKGEISYVFKYKTGMACYHLHRL